MMYKKRCFNLGQVILGDHLSHHQDEEAKVMKEIAKGI